MVVECVDRVIEDGIEHHVLAVEMEDVEPRSIPDGLQHDQVVSFGELGVLVRREIALVGGLACEEQTVGALHLLVLDPHGIRRHFVILIKSDLMDSPVAEIAAIQIPLTVKAEPVRPVSDIRKRLELAENNFLTLHYLNEVVAASVEVNDDDIRAYYATNTGEFKGPKGQPLPLEEVRERIVTKLAREPRRDAVDAFVRDAMQKANAEVDVQSLLGGDPHFQ